MPANFLIAFLRLRFIFAKSKERVLATMSAIATIFKQNRKKI